MRIMTLPTDYNICCYSNKYRLLKSTNYKPREEKDESVGISDMLNRLELGLEKSTTCLTKIHVMKMSKSH